MVVGLWGVYEGAKKDAGVQRAAGLSGRMNVSAGGFSGLRMVMSHHLCRRCHGEKLAMGYFESIPQ